ncbi:MAG: DNA-directed RNA polymerase subunit N [Candidatus Hydrothermarchaeales archaeon]
MIIPVRCFSCGGVVADKYEEFKKRIEKENPKEVLDSLGVKRYCCRRMILSQADFIDELIEFDEKGSE